MNQEGLKKEINPLVTVAAVVVVLAIVIFFGYRALRPLPGQPVEQLMSPASKKMNEDMKEWAKTFNKQREQAAAQQGAATQQAAPPVMNPGGR